MGWQQYTKQLFNKTTKKDMNISFYKSGFGGKNIPIFAGLGGGSSNAASTLSALNKIMLLKKKTAIITGCNRGIGEKILEKFSSSGANIFACTRKKNRAIKVSK